MRGVINLICGLIPFSKPRRKVRNFLRWRLSLIFRRPFVRREKYDRVISIGDMCCVANALVKAGMRGPSGPFDWVRGFNGLDSYVNMLMNGFDGWLNEDDLEFMYAEGPLQIYKNRRTEYGFYHDFTTRHDWDTEYKIIKDKYDRRIDRLLSVLNSDARIMLIYSDERGLDIEVLRDALNTLRSKFPAHLDLMYAYRTDDWNVPDVKYPDGITVFRIAKFERWGDDNYRLATRQLIRRLARIKL